MSCEFTGEVVHSLDLLTNDQCLPLLDTYSIRYHDAMKHGVHFDYAIGAYNLELCVDFIIFGELTPDELARGDNLPLPGQQKWMNFMPAHDSSVIFTYPLGVWNTIPVGEYGAGKWKILRTGKASVQRVSAHSYIIELDDMIFKVYKPPRFDNFKIILSK